MRLSYRLSLLDLMIQGDPNPRPAIKLPEPDGFVSRIFLNPEGLRSGWGFSLYVIAVLLLVWLSQSILRAIFGHPIAVETPGRVITAETALLCSPVLPALVAARLERRPWAVYGLPLR